MLRVRAWVRTHGGTSTSLMNSSFETTTCATRHWSHTEHTEVSTLNTPNTHGRTQAHSAKLLSSEQPRENEHGSKAIRQRTRRASEGENVARAAPPNYSLSRGLPRRLGWRPHKDWELQTVLWSVACWLQRARWRLLHHSKEVRLKRRSDSDWTDR